VDDEAPRAFEGAPHGPGVTVRAILIALVLTVLSGIWVRQAEIVVLATQITESVPPIPALAALLLLVALNPLLAMLGRRFALTRGELLAIYCFIAVAISVLGVGVARFWLALLTACFYFATPSNRFATLHDSFPDWLVVKDPRAIHDLYVRSPTGQVPWSVWAVPLLVWTAFFLALWLCMWCLILLVRQRWVDAERLTFPIVELPLEITATAGQRSQPRFLRDPLMWAGFGLAALYNVWNIVHALAPSIPAPGKELDLNPYLESPPWNSLQPFDLWYRPELIGFGFLVPSEILFSMWFFYLLSKVEALLAVQYAYDIPGIPFEQEQSIGAFLLLGVWLLWQARGDVAASLRSVLRIFDRRLPDPASRIQNPESEGWAAVGFLASLAFLVWFCAKAGMATWAAMAYLGVVLLTALVCARIRAEAGVPLIWLFPFYMQKKVLLYTLGTAPFLLGGPSTLVIFALLTFLSRGYFPSLIGYQIESLKIADEARMSRARMGWLAALAVVVGFGVAFYFHLAPYYLHGGQNLRGGIWGSDMAIQEYTDVITAQNTPLRPDLYRTIASFAGAALTALLLLLRRSFVGFPLHPTGYAVATAYGSLVWWPFFVTWLLKWAILKWGGMRSYRRAIPFFLGFALGHFFVAGAVWGFLGALWEEGAQAYPVWFG